MQVRSGIWPTFSVFWKVIEHQGRIERKNVPHKKDLVYYAVPEKKWNFRKNYFFWKFPHPSSQKSMFSKNTLTQFLKDPDTRVDDKLR